MRAAKFEPMSGSTRTVLDSDRMCLCGMLAADYATLPNAMKEGVRGFFDANEAWLAEVLQQGREKGELTFKGPSVEAARVLVSALEGSMLLARSHGDHSRLQSAANRLLADLGVRAPVSEDAARERTGGRCPAGGGLRNRHRHCTTWSCRARRLTAAVASSLP